MNDLMRPRYKVIANYPYSDFEVGQIVQLEIMRTPHFGQGDEPEEWHTKFLLRKDGGKTMYSERFFKPYPHLFKPLQWWEERKPEGMPLYVRYEGRVSKTRLLIWNEDNSVTEKPNEGMTPFHLDNQYILKGFGYHEVEPATEKEYLATNTLPANY